MDIRILTAPGLGDSEALLAAIGKWVCARYAAEIERDVKPLLGRQVVFTDPLTKLGKVSGRVKEACFCVDDTELFRFVVEQDGGEVFRGLKLSQLDASPAYDDDQSFVGRRVRVVVNPTGHNIYLSEGYIQQVWVGGSGRTFVVDISGRGTFQLKETDVRLV